MPVLPNPRPAEEPAEPTAPVAAASTALASAPEVDLADVAGLRVPGDVATDDIPQVERQLARDMVRNGLIATPVLLLVCGAVWGWVGVSSCAYGLALVFANFLIAAGMLGWAARRGGSVLLGVALGGFLVRMLLLVLAIAVVKDQAWIEMAPLGATILVTYLGLLFWETRYVSASLAFPGLKPRTKGA